MGVSDSLIFAFNFTGIFITFIWTAFKTLSSFLFLFSVSTNNTLPNIFLHIYKHHTSTQKNEDKKRTERKKKKKCIKHIKLRVFKIRRIYISAFIVCISRKLLLLCFPEVQLLWTNTINIFCCKSLKYVFYLFMNNFFYVYLLSVTNCIIHFKGCYPNLLPFQYSHCTKNEVFY